MIFYKPQKAYNTRPVVFKSKNQFSSVWLSNREKDGNTGPLATVHPDREQHNLVTAGTGNPSQHFRTYKPDQADHAQPTAHRLSVYVADTGVPDWFWLDMLVPLSNLPEPASGAATKTRRIPEPSAGQDEPGGLPLYYFAYSSTGDLRFEKTIICRMACQVRDCTWTGRVRDVNLERDNSRSYRGPDSFASLATHRIGNGSCRLQTTPF